MPNFVFLAPLALRVCFYDSKLVLQLPEACHDLFLRSLIRGVGCFPGRRVFNIVKLKLKFKKDLQYIRAGESHKDVPVFFVPNSAFARRDFVSRHEFTETFGSGTVWFDRFTKLHISSSILVAVVYNRLVR